MGQDKATLDVAGTTLLDRTLAGVPVGVDVIVAGPPVSVGRAGVRFVREVPPGGGPVAGVKAALDAIDTAVVVVLATDLPLVGALPVALAESLLGSHPTGQPVDAVLAVDASGRAQQLCAAYRAEALRDAISANGSADGAAMRAVVARLNTATLSTRALRPTRGETAEIDPTWDIDTQQDVQALEDLLGHGINDS